MRIPGKTSVEDRANLEAMAMFDRLLLGAARTVKKKGTAGVAPVKTESQQLGCHPSQVKEFNEKAKKSGFVGVEYQPDGTCIMPSFGKERTRFLKQNQTYDKSAYYD